MLLLLATVSAWVHGVQPKTAFPSTARRPLLAPSPRPRMSLYDEYRKKMGGYNAAPPAMGGPPEASPALQRAMEMAGMQTPGGPPQRPYQPRQEENFFNAVPLTGVTLDASLKMRCDVTGASYAIYWADVRGEFQAVREYVTPGRKAELSRLGLVPSYSEALMALGTQNTVMGIVKRTGEPVFVPNAATSAGYLVRRDTAIRYSIESVSFEPYEAGIIEYGTTTGSDVRWTERPTPPNVPKAELRKAFEELGALYAMFWGYDDSTAPRQIKPYATYESTVGQQLQARMRSDGDSFLARSKELSFDADGTGPVATAARGSEVIIVVAGDGADKEVLVTVDGVTTTDRFEGCAGLSKRTRDIAEFGIRSIHLVPVQGGVLEYGVSGEASLTDVTLDATIELECEAAGASYAIFWKESIDGRTSVARGFATPNFRRECAALGFSVDYAQASEAFGAKLTLVGDESPVAVALRTRNPVFIPDVMSYAGEFRRRDVALSYKIRSIVFQPVLGGVVEMGISGAKATFGERQEWSSLEASLVNKIPNAALEAAFSKNGATYAIFWRRNFQKGIYELAANYETLANALNRRAGEDDRSFATESAATTFNIVGEECIAVAGSAAVEIEISDLQGNPPRIKCGNSPKFLGYTHFARGREAREWGVGKICLIPCETGVLEYGTVTLDKRSTTVGGEYQETQRQYRRDVFGIDDWVRHRSTSRFEKSMRTIFQSGILRARYKEVTTVVGFAAFICFYDGLVGGFADLGGFKHDGLLSFLPMLTLPLPFFTLTSGSLGLLLVFRTNACYARWDDSRKIWGDIINKCRSLVRQANTFFDDDYPGFGKFRDGRRRVAAETSAFTRCLRTFLRGEVDAPKLEVELKELGFTASEVASYMGSGNRQVYALGKLGYTIRTAAIDPMERSRMDTTLSALCDDVGACERIFRTPIPTVYTGHTARFVGTWLLLLPLALYQVDISWNHLVMIPTAGMVAFFLLGIEELGLQIEEPFSILPIEVFCDASIGAPLWAMVYEEDKDRAREQQAQRAATAAKLAELELEATDAPIDVRSVQG